MYIRLYLNFVYQLQTCTMHSMQTISLFLTIILGFHLGIVNSVFPYDHERRNEDNPSTNEYALDSQRCDFDKQTFSLPDPSYYTVCQIEDGKFYETQLICDKNNYFNSLQGNCNKVPGGGQAVSRHITQICPDKFLGLIKDLNVPMLYHVCEEHDKFIAACNAADKFDDQIKTCVSSTGIQTIISRDDSIGTVPVGSCKWIGQFAVPYYNRYYYKCIKGDYPQMYQEIYKCNDDKIYDNVIGECVTVARTFRIFVPETVHCRNYHLCALVTGSLFKCILKLCPDYTAFDKHTQHCVSIEQVNCINETALEDIGIPFMINIDHNFEIGSRKRLSEYLQTKTVNMNTLPHLGNEMTNSEKTCEPVQKTSPLKKYFNPYSNKSNGIQPINGIPFKTNSLSSKEDDFKAQKKFRSTPVRYPTDSANNVLISKQGEQNNLEVDINLKFPIESLMQTLMKSLAANCPYRKDPNPENTNTMLFKVNKTIPLSAKSIKFKNGDSEENMKNHSKITITENKENYSNESIPMLIKPQNSTKIIETENPNITVNALNNPNFTIPENNTTNDTVSTEKKFKNVNEESDSNKSDVGHTTENPTKHQRSNSGLGTLLQRGKEKDTTEMLKDIERKVHSYDKTEEYFSEEEIIEEISHVKNDVLKNLQKKKDLINEKVNTETDVEKKAEMNDSFNELRNKIDNLNKNLELIEYLMKIKKRQRSKSQRKKSKHNSHKGNKNLQPMNPVNSSTNQNESTNSIHTTVTFSNEFGSQTTTNQRQNETLLETTTLSTTLINELPKTNDISTTTTTIITKSALPVFNHTEQNHSTHDSLTTLDGIHKLQPNRSTNRGHKHQHIHHFYYNHDVDSNQQNDSEPVVILKQNDKEVVVTPYKENTKNYTILDAHGHGNIETFKERVKINGGEREDKKEGDSSQKNLKIVEEVFETSNK